jgi:ATPase family AAA domain-containing protein 2
MVRSLLLSTSFEGLFRCELGVLYRIRGVWTISNMAILKRTPRRIVFRSSIMTRSGAKRTLEELANKSDPDDYDYSDHPVRTSRYSASKSSKKKAKPPAKKKRRQDSDDDLESDDALSDVDELSSQASEEYEDENVEKNARGLARRTAARNRPVYKEDDSSNGEEDEEEEGEEVEEQEAKTPPKSKNSNVITLKIGKGPKRLPTSDVPPVTRRSTRHNRNPSEDIYALTNSGRHIQTIERGTRSPDVQQYRTRRRSRSQHSKNVIEKDDEGAGHAKDPEAEQEVTAEDPKDSQLEIMESDPQADFDEGSPAAEIETENNVDAGMAGASVVLESESGDARVEEDEDDEGPHVRRRSRVSRQHVVEGAEQLEETVSEPRRSSRKKPAKPSHRRQEDDGSDFEPNEEDSDDGSPGSHGPFLSPRKRSQAQDEDDESSNGRRPGLRKRKSQSRGRGDSEAAADIAEELAEELENLKGDRPRRRIQPEIIYEKPRRSRKDVDYRIIRPDLVLPIEEAEIESAESPSRRGRGGGGSGWQRTLFSTYGPFGGGGPAAILGPPGAPGATGGVESDSSDDETMQNPKGAGGPGMTPSTAVGPGFGLTGSAQAHGAEAVQGPSGTPANFGRLKDKQALADSDPLGIDPNVNFDSVGGLQDHIDQLKEMVSLPLLYPEIFQRFHIVPPRGVLFHGPPGTGKTLMARALASSVSSEGRKVTFYMRKGADALSKWVGEAERQLRLLFEEARKTQPSIIFFDEIDGKCFSARVRCYYRIL